MNVNLKIPNFSNLFQKYFFKVILQAVQKKCFFMHTCRAGAIKICSSRIKEYVLVIECTVPPCVFQRCVSHNLFLLW